MEQVIQVLRKYRSHKSLALSALVTGCSPMAHAFTQIPYAVLGAIISFIILIILGHVFA